MSAFSVITQICRLLTLGCIAALVNPSAYSLYWRISTLETTIGNHIVQTSPHRAGKWGPELCPRPWPSLGSTPGFLPPAQFHFHRISWLPRQEPVTPMKPVLLALTVRRLPSRCRKHSVTQLSYLPVQLSESELLLFWLQFSILNKKQQEGHWGTEVLARRGSQFQQWHHHLNCLLDSSS